MAEEDLFKVMFVDSYAKLFFSLTDNTLGERFIRLEMATARSIKFIVHIASIGALLEKELGAARIFASEKEINSDVNSISLIGHVNIIA